jgi:hypothetical protein
MASKKNWLSPVNKLRWYKAFNKKANTVELDDGRKFTIEYEMMDSKVTDETWEVARVRGPDVNDPSGYFRMKTVTEREWIFTDDSKPKGLDTLYQTYINSFIMSSEEGVDVKEEWPELKLRTKTALRSGLNNAISALGKKAKGLQVITRGDTVYLLKVDNGE